jgi:hypothetical protein
LAQKQGTSGQRNATLQMQRITPEPEIRRPKLLIVGVLEPTFDMSLFALNKAQIFKPKGVKNENTRLYVCCPCCFFDPDVGMHGI